MEKRDIISKTFVASSRCLFLVIFLFAGCYGRDVVRLTNEYTTLSKEFEKNKGEILQRISQAEDELKKTFRSKADIATDIDNFKIDVGGIKGSIEEMQLSLNEISIKQIEKDKNYSAELAKLSQSIKAIEERLLRLEKTTFDVEKENALSTGKLTELERNVSKLGSNIDNKGNKKNNYENGLDLFNSGKYEEAISAFDQSIKEKSKEKKDSQNGKAQFWIGESYFKLKDYERAILEYQKVIEKYKKSEKICASTFKQGLSFIKLGKQKEAKIFLESVISECESETHLVNDAEKELKLVNENKNK